MNLFCTLGSTVYDWGWPKNGPFWTKNGQTWQACQRFKVVQRGPKGSKMVNLDVLVLKISKKHNLIACRNSLNGDYNNRKHYLPLS